MVSVGKCFILFITRYADLPSGGTSCRLILLAHVVAPGPCSQPVYWSSDCWLANHCLGAESGPPPVSVNQCSIGTQPCPSFNIVCDCFQLQKHSRRVATETEKPRSGKYLLSGSLQKKCVPLWSKLLCCFFFPPTETATGGSCHVNTRTLCE